jgi:methanogenic corrinoid protein MtbC1
MTAYRYVRTGRLPARRDGVQWLVDASDVERLLADATATQSQPKPRVVRERWRSDLASRLVAGDEAGAWTLVENAMTSSLSPDDVYVELLAPAMREIGDGWADGRYGVADEHRATVVAQRLLGRLGPRFARRGRKRGTVVVTTPPGEQHGLPSAIVADLLRGVGFDVIDLGADVPAESTADAARDANRLLAVVIGATTPGRDAAVRAAVRALRNAEVDVPVILGGAAIDDDEHARRLGADDWSGHDGRSLVDAVERVTSTGAATQP